VKSEEGKRSECQKERKVKSKLREEEIGTGYPA